MTIPISKYGWITFRYEKERLDILNSLQKKMGFKNRDEFLASILNQFAMKHIQEYVDFEKAKLAEQIETVGHISDKEVLEKFKDEPIEPKPKEPKTGP